MKRLPFKGALFFNVQQMPQTRFWMTVASTFFGSSEQFSFPLASMQRVLTSLLAMIRSSCLHPVGATHRNHNFAYLIISDAGAFFVLFCWTFWRLDGNDVA